MRGLEGRAAQQALSHIVGSAIGQFWIWRWQSMASCLLPFQTWACMCFGSAHMANGLAMLPEQPANFHLFVKLPREVRLFIPFSLFFSFLSLRCHSAYIRRLHCHLRAPRSPLIFSFFFNHLPILSSFSFFHNCKSLEWDTAYRIHISMLNGKFLVSNL